MAMLTTTAITTSFIFFLLIFTSSNAYGVGSVEKGRRMDVESAAEHRKAWMNHGSSRGPRKPLVNPTVQRPFQSRELPL
ncbi:hypothetical protein TIFTF001_010070 [Ficus carica]|uniref:Uncharacterized protein n=1 Tax=Ficus carica TaxID=3494 RepID=A0AA88D450_FICCA|nr:hypothetical protein TIFTF001_010070 [Ficus carica]